MTAIFGWKKWLCLLLFGGDLANRLWCFCCEAYFKSDTVVGILIVRFLMFWIGRPALSLAVVISIPLMGFQPLEVKQGPLLLFWDWFSLFAPTYVHFVGDRTPPSWVVWWLRGPIMSIRVYNCLYSLYLQVFGNCSQGWTRIVEVWANDFFRFSHDVMQRGTEFEGRPWNTSTGKPPIDSYDVN
jgi:hypothetical protein